MPYLRIWRQRQAIIKARVNCRPGRMPGSSVALPSSHTGGESRGKADKSSHNSALCHALLWAIQDCASIVDQSASLVCACGNGQRSAHVSSGGRVGGEDRGRGEQVTGQLRFGGWSDTDIFSAPLCKELEKAHWSLPADPEPGLQRVLASQSRCIVHTLPEAHVRSCLHHHGSIPVALQCALVTAGLPQSASAATRTARCWLMPYVCQPGAAPFNYNPGEWKRDSRLAGI